MGTSVESQAAVNSVLGSIIDDWFDRVSSYYITAERIATSGDAKAEEELKRFHDEKGHRIKFSKDELDFTYGLRSYSETGDLLIEVSVNNKVENFDVGEFRDRLAVYYAKTGVQPVPTPPSLRECAYSEIFQLDSDFSDALTLELREGKADIMRLSFRLNSDHLKDLLSQAGAFKQLVENFCVTPFRSIYASVYRRGG